jgi:type II secretory ATPase GspE/PulE/Tfp pilus assembly ATPase PilB-like protein
VNDFNYYPWGLYSASDMASGSPESAKMAVQQNINPSEKEIEVVAKKQGLLDMKEDGVVKILKGITSISELGRVIDLTE